MRRGLALGLIIVAAIGIAVLGWRLWSARHGPGAPSLLVSAAITLPADTETLPAGPHADLVASRCTACHSAGMILAQPPLSREQWQATLTKMREAYRAPVPAEDDPAILAYLTALSAAKKPS